MAAKKAQKGLGKGLGALFNTDEVIENVLEGQGVTELKITEIEPNKNQPRRKFDEEKLEALAESIKEYGVLHPTNLIYVVSYFVAMIVAIAISLKRNTGKLQTVAGLMLAVVLGNIGMWFVEKIISWHFEMLSVSYLMSELVFFFVYLMMYEYLEHGKTEQLGVDIATMPMETKIGKILFRVKSDEPLTAREREILELILQNKKRKDIAEEMRLSENTVKTYTRTLYAKIGVGSREELNALLIQN
jgi:DNA-binding CsgD family transcriptional regulator